MRNHDDIFKALADPHRREIVSALFRESMAAGELARLVNLAPNAVSFHLKWLKSAGLVSIQRRGRHLWYSLDASTLAEWQSHVNSYFNAAQPAIPVTAMPFTPQTPRIRREVSDRPLLHSIAAADGFSDDYLPTELL